jgi:outer membrane protein assembly factor BamB
MGHDRVFAVRPTDGAVLWSHPLAETEEPTRAPLPIDGEHVLVSRFRDSTLLRVTREGGAVKVTPLWTSPRLKGSYAPNVHRDGLLFGFSGQFLMCVDARTGEPRWRQKVNAGTLIRVGERLIVLGEQSGLLRVVEATGEGYRQAAEAAALNAGAQSSTGPSYSDGRVYVRNTEEMVAYALESAGARADAREVRP